ncbi:MAG: hypothetical protein NVSMB9_21920 [Isosphaeraceae bacterium]
MVRSFRRVFAGLTCLLLCVAPLSPSARGAEPPAPPAEKDHKKVKARATPEISRNIERSPQSARPGEDIPQPFVPEHPRTVQDRKKIEAITAYSVARALEDKRQWSEAIVLLEEALKSDPDSITILRRLSRLCFVLGRTEAGIKYCKRVLDVDPGDTDTITRLVGYYNRRSDPRGAETVLKDVLANPRLEKRAPGRRVAEYELGKLYSGPLRQIEKSADSFERVMAALDHKAATRLSQADQRRILGGNEAEAYQEFGLVFLQAKRLEQAVTAFQHGLSYNPDDPQLPLLLAQTLLTLGKGTDALAQVEAFLKRQPQGVDGYELLAKILTSLKRGDEILPRLEQAAKNDSKNVALQYVLADRYREAGQVERADAMYKALIAAQPTTQGFTALAASLLKRKKPEELLKVIEQAITRPGGLEAVQVQIKGIIDDPEFAGQVFDAGLKLLSADPPALDRPGISVLAYIATRAGKLDKLLPIQRLALKRNPSPQTYKEVITLLLGLKKIDEATATFEEMLKKFPAERNPRQLVELAKYYRFGEKLDESARAAREALKLDPNDLDAQIQLATVLSQTGKANEAVDMLKAAMKKDAANPLVSATLGNILNQSGRNDEALTIFKTMIEKFPNNDEVIRIARSNLSIIYVNQGDYAKGESELEALLERNPDEAGVNNDLGYLYAEQGKNLEKAESMIRKAIQEEPENSAYLDSLGWVLFKRGKVKEALEPLEKATKNVQVVSASDATIFEHLGDVYFQLQQPAKARSAWKSAELAATKSSPPDKRLPEIRKKLDSLEKLDKLPKNSTGDTP